MPIILILFLVITGPCYALDADLSKRHIDITSAYAGEDLVVFGVSKPDQEIIVIAKGPEAPLTVRHKQPVLGLWVNRASVTFQKVPRFYAVFSSRPVGDLLPADILKAQTIGLDTLHFDTAESADQARPNLPHFVEALIRSQQKQDLFQSASGRIERVGEHLFRLTLSLPAAAPAGDYAVRVLAVRHKQIEDEALLRLRVEQTGLIAGVQNFVYRHGLWHGVFLLMLAGMMGAGGYLLLRRE